MTTTNDVAASGTAATARDVPEVIARIYRETLDDGDLDTAADFFEAGGDSLTAFQIAERVEQELGVEVPVALVFAYPSPADLAAVVGGP